MYRIELKNGSFTTAANGVELDSLIKGNELRVKSISLASDVAVADIEFRVVWRHKAKQDRRVMFVDAVDATQARDISIYTIERFYHHPFDECELQSIQQVK